jgi:predicted metal-dependent phosphoesterase TrpH
MKIDMHVHSRYSPDSKMGPRDIVKAAKKIGLSWVAITDHYSIEGSLNAKREETDGVRVLRGIEVSTSHGHILGYGIKEGVRRDMPPEETVERIRELGGVASIAHPDRFWSGVGVERAKALDTDLIETFNSRTSARGNRMAERIAIQREKPMTAGSDAHDLDHIGKGLLILDQEPETEDELIHLLLNGDGRTAGESRTIGNTIRYAANCVGEWAGRGFRRI